MNASLAITAAFPLFAGTAIAQPTAQPTTQPATESTAPSRQPAPDEAGQAPKSRIPVVTLIDPGQAPRTELRYTPKLNEPQHVVMMLDTYTERATFGGDPQPQETPAITVLWVQTPTAKQGDRFTYELKVTSLEVEGDTTEANATRAALAPMVGATGATTVTTRGLSEGITFADLEKFDPTVAQQFAAISSGISQSIVQFPAEAVGPGASWKVNHLVEANGFDLDVESTYTVTKMDTRSLELAVTSKQAASRQQIHAPGIPATWTLFINEYDGTAETTCRVIPGFLSPVSLSRTGKGVADLEIVQPQGNPIPVVQTMEFEVRIETSDQGL